MALLKQNKFTSWTLTPEEEISGSILSPLQILVLQNKLSEVATQLLNLEYDPNNPQKFLQDEAFLTGQMQTIEWLIDLSEETKNTPVLSQSNQEN